MTGDVTETIGALHSITTAQNVTLGVGGNCVELVGAARLETIKGGRSESTGGKKAETVGLYTIKAKEDIALDAGAAAGIRVSGAMRQKVGGARTVSGKEGGQLITKELKLKASGSVTLVCGMAKVVIDGKGIQFDGKKEVTVEGDKIELKASNIGPG